MQSVLPVPVWGVTTVCVVYVCVCMCVHAHAWGELFISALQTSMEFAYFFSISMYYLHSYKLHTGHKYSSILKKLILKNVMRIWSGVPSSLARPVGCGCLPSPKRLAPLAVTDSCCRDPSRPHGGAAGLAQPLPAPGG